ncbi:hypothetical protein CIB95_02155 [Lottiidibacillus patelloidae]|uniref:SHOCT domain-containing protein n=1 Tax=Lottiidibacillus patelloidae TaxID=2670334 RepID=A0A263BXG1_9BACI|nr:SHOCT domain-containing protein [Lottiidibacillus patelloidae]OZM58394.1 hypothetical protein CIB95_02155 [Lottiidibacillus patelloidae]
MFPRYGVKPSKGMSAISVFIGIIFIFIGITQVAKSGFFGVIWTLIALAITGYHAANLFTTKGVSAYQVDVLDNNKTKESTQGDYETKLRKLYRLKEDNIISEEEYEKKKQELLNEKW